MTERNTKEMNKQVRRQMKRCRNVLGFKDYEMAKTLKLAPGTFSTWQRGLVDLPVSRVERMSKALQGIVKERAHAITAMAAEDRHQQVTAREPEQAIAG